MRARSAAISEQPFDSTGVGSRGVASSVVGPDRSEMTQAGVATLASDASQPGFGLKRLGAAARAAAATTWAATLLLTGLWVAMNGPERWPVPRELCLMGGSSLLAGGQFLFLVLVADRVFPRASSRLVWAIEVLLFAAFVLGLGAALYMLATSVGAGLPMMTAGEAH